MILLVSCNLNNAVIYASSKHCPNKKIMKNANEIKTANSHKVRALFTKSKNLTKKESFTYIKRQR